MPQLAKTINHDDENCYCWHERPCTVYCLLPEPDHLSQFYLPLHSGMAALLSESHKLRHANFSQTNPGLKERDWQVLVVPYDNQSSLSYILRGVDVVISTISGEAQLALVDAAATAQVRHFIPSGFSGPQQCAPQMVAASTNEWQSLISRLEHHQLESSMRYTIFTCGIFYEQFCPGGLNAMQISTITSQNAGIGEEGAFLVDLRAGKAMIPVTPGSQQEAVICMTSARDTARYLVAAMQTYKDMTIWPNEFKFCTERMTVSELLNTCSRVRGTHYTFPFLSTCQQ